MSASGEPGPAGPFATEPCSGHTPVPGAGARPASWSPVFGAWLCGECLGFATRAELGATEKANAVAANEAAANAAAARRAPGGTA